MLCKIAVGATICTAGLGAMLYAFQDRIIYLRRRYEGDPYYANVRENVRTVRYGEKSEFTGYHIPSTLESPTSEDLWILFGGNAGLALDWYDFCIDIQRKHPRTSFLLADYVGYGENRGDPSPESIERSVAELFHAFMREHTVDARNVRLGLLGHSLGAAVALQFASGTALERYDGEVRLTQIILLSPFTSMLDMAYVILGRIPLLPSLLRHRWDNVATMKALLAKKHDKNVGVYIAHGTEDAIVPFSQGKHLFSVAQRNIEQGVNDVTVEFDEVTGATHNDIISGAYRGITRAMQPGP